MNSFNGKRLNINLIDWDTYISPEDKKKVAEQLKSIKQRLNLPNLGRPLLMGTSGESKVDKYWFKNYFGK